MKENRLDITRVLALVTLTVFALCLLLVLLGGAGVYRNLVEGAEENYNRLTALHYLTTRVRQAENLEIGEFHGSDALVLQERVDGETYLTWIYCWDGWLMELYALPGGSFLPADGQQVLQVQHMACTLEEDLLKLELDQGELLLYLGVNP